MSFDPEKVMHYHGWHVDEDPDDTSDRSFHFVSRADYDKLLALLHDVSSEADPAGTLRELRMAQDTIRALEARIAELETEAEKLKGRREHTQEWYASHYGKLEDWARTRLPDPWRNEFFSCIANGTWGHKDVGEAYKCNAGFKVVPSGYIHMDDAKGQLVLDQTRRAEDAETEVERLQAEISRLKEERK